MRMILLALMCAALPSCNTFDDLMPSRQQQAPVAETVTPMTGLRYQLMDRISARIAARRTEVQ